MPASCAAHTSDEGSSEHEEALVSKNMLAIMSRLRRVTLITIVGRRRLDAETARMPNVKRICFKAECATAKLRIHPSLHKNP